MDADDLAGEPLLAVTGLAKSFPLRRSWRGRVIERLHAVRGVSLVVQSGEALGVVGESGSGKSTMARLLLQLTEPDAGSVRFAGTELTTATRDQLRQARRRLPLVFQDPYSSLDPTWRVADLVAEPLRIAGRPKAERRAAAATALDRVGLEAETFAPRYSRDLSGGQRQRVAIARALVTDPLLLICDEATSALDVSSGAGVIGVVQDLQDTLGIGLLFISHDLTLVRTICDRVAVMYLGRIVESGPVAQVYDTPAHPYTQALVAAAPAPDPTRRRRRHLADGEPPSPISVPGGCPYRSRCGHATDVCAASVPELLTVEPASPRDRQVACHHPVHLPERTAP